VVWAFEARRPDLEELAAIYTPRPGAVLADTGAATAPPTAVSAVISAPIPASGEPGVSTVDEAPATPETPVSETAEEIYIVQPGDTLLVIATRYNLLMDDILRANNLTDPNLLFSGQRLVIPVQGGTAPPGDAMATEEPTTEPVVDGVAITTVSGAGDLANEQVLVANESATPFSLEGWRLEREGCPAYTFGNVPLFPGGSVRVFSGAGVDTSLDLFWNQPNPVWQSGAVARLLNTQGVVVSSYTVP
jgi:LysM repeat protein